MKWIKYQIVCGKNQNEEDILINKKVGYSAENIAIAEKEAYNGYTIEEDAESFNKEPIAIELGGTHANNANDARKNLGAFAAADYDGLFAKTGNPVQATLKQGRGISIITTMLPLQAGSGDPSPSNIRPISSRTGVKLTRCGKNLLPDCGNNSATANGITLTCKDGVYKIEGTATTNTTVTLPLSEIMTVPTGTYIHLGNPVADASIVLTLRHTSGTVTNILFSAVNRIASTADFVGKTIQAISVQVGSGKTVNFTFAPMIKLGSTVTPYEPYQGDTYTADFGQAVYGGTLDWQTGVLTVDRAFYTFDGSENFVNGGWNNPYSYVRWDLFPDVVKYQMSVVADAYCSHYAVGSVGYVITNEIAGFGIYDRGHMIFSSPTHADVDAFKSYLAAQHAAGTPVQVCYKLATPQTIQLTPQEMIEALDGLNTVHTDCGSNDVTFNHDLPLLNAVPKPTPESIGAAPANHTHTPESIGAAKSNHTHADFAYSEAEVNTGKTWIDGKPIYKKTIAITSTISAPTGVTMKVVGAILDIDVPIKIYGAVAYHSDNAPYTWYQLGSHADLEDKMWTGSTIDVATGQVKLYVSNLTIGSGYITVEYTKKTN